jgi:hypothetical protein
MDITKLIELKSPVPIRFTIGTLPLKGGTGLRESSFVKEVSRNEAGDFLLDTVKNFGLQMSLQTACVRDGSGILFSSLSEVEGIGKRYSGQPDPQGHAQIKI